MNGGTRSRETRSLEAGFTLVEVLVVLAILATLMALVAALVPYALRQKDKLRAQSLVNNIGGTLELLKNDSDQFGKYPPSRARDLRIGKRQVGKDLGQPNEINCGIECVYFLLNNPDIRIDHPPTTGDDQVGNTDEDSFRNARGNASDALAREFLDPWRNPLVYFSSLDYNDPKGVNQVKLGPEYENAVVEVRPKKESSKTGGGFLFKQTFQLFSLGPDGKQDDDDAEEGDDIVYGRQ